MNRYVRYALLLGIVVAALTMGRDARALQSGAGFLIPIGHHFLDDSGNPLNGGKLYTYQAGTSTPQAIYTTEDLNVAHANPAILSAAGRLTAFVQEGVSYKYRLTTSADVLVREWDQVAVPDIEAPPAAAEVPTGGIIAYGGTSAPTGFLLCDGSAVSRTTYAALFAIVGTSFGPGNGSTTFNLPDMRQRFPLGKAASGTGATLGATGGTIDHVHAGPAHTHGVGTLTIPSGGAHTHTTDAPSATTVVQSGSGATVASSTHTHAVSSSGAHTHTPTGATASDGTGNTGTANPPFTAVNFVIKT